MTLRSDVAELLAGAGILDVDVEDALADEHVRSSAYQRVVEVTAASPVRDRDRDRAIVAMIVRDPHQMGARSAVVALVDRMARKAGGPAEFRLWSDGLVPEFDRLTSEKDREFVRNRCVDWLFCLSVEDGHVPQTAELARVTDWMQRLLAEVSTSRAVLDLLAESGRTKKTRNIATNRAISRRP